MEACYFTLLMRQDYLTIPCYAVFRLFQSIILNNATKYAKYGLWDGSNELDVHKQHGSFIWRKKAKQRFIAEYHVDKLKTLKTTYFVRMRAHLRLCIEHIRNGCL